MEILLNSNEMTLDNYSQNLEGILQEVTENYLNDGQIVWSVKVNGQNYNEAKPHDAKRIGINEIQLLEIGTKTKNEMLMEFLKNSDEVIGMIKESAIKISGLFRMTDTQDANKHYMLFIETYQYLFQMIQQSINSQQPDFLAIVSDSKTITSKVETLEKLFNEMIASQKKEDWIMLADLLEYELTPLLDEWAKLLTLLAKML